MTLLRHCLLGLTGLLAPFTATAADWRPLFNGKDLAGWETFLARPPASADVPGLARDAKGAYAAPIGRNRDPLGVFAVVEADGRPALRFSGQVFGVLTTTEEFANYHLRLQFKWGARKWPPREQAVRDSGLLYHVHGEPGASSGVWPASIELQIQEHDCGDLYAILTQISVPARPAEGPNGRTLYQYDPAGPPTDFKQERPVGNRCIRLADHEKPSGEWNTVELICVGGDSIHVVNGQVVMRLRQARRQAAGGGWEPLSAGRISLQTEGAEVFYRDVEIRPVAAVPAEFAGQ